MTILDTPQLPWVEKRIPALSPDRRGLYKLLSTPHGLTQFEVRLTRIPPGETNTWFHQHSRIEEWFYVLKGSCHFHAHGAWTEVREGHSLASLPGEWHMFRNFGAEPCDLLMVGSNLPDDQIQRAEEPPPPPSPRTL